MATNIPHIAATEEIEPDEPPTDLLIGAVNPRALVEALVGRAVNWSDTTTSTQLMVDTLKKPYEELFDPKFGSPLFGGLAFDAASNKLSRAKLSDIKLLNDSDLLTPDLSVLKQLADLKAVGIEDLKEVPVRQAWLSAGRLNLQLTVPALDKTLTNLAITKPIFDITLAAAAGAAANEWTPPTGTSWKDVGDFLRDVTDYDDPIQGAIGDCWLIAALAAVAWSTPQYLVHRPRRTGANDEHVNQITLYTKGGSHDHATGTVEVSDSVVVNGSNTPIYCRPRETGEMWASIYEKAFAKWSTGNGTDKPDITALAYGDPIKAVCQLTNRKAYYYATSNKAAADLYGLVRANSVSYKTINPMTAWTYGSGAMYTNSGIVANHAYTVLGWASSGGKSYLILRNPWGYFEPNGSTTLQGTVSFFDASFWRWINMVGNDGVFALEAGAFKTYFAYLAAAKTA